VSAGEILFEPGDTSVPSFILLSRTMAIVQPDGAKEIPVAQHAPGGSRNLPFSGVWAGSRGRFDDESNRR